MKYGRVLTYKDVEEAKKIIGKKVVVSDYFYSIAECPEERYKCVLEVIKNDRIYPFITTGGNYQFIREVIEEKPQHMTNMQLAEWCAEGKGLWKHNPSTSISETVYHYYWFFEVDMNKEVPNNIVIMPKGSDEWIAPTIDIYERDCKGGNE